MKKIFFFLLLGGLTYGQNNKVIKELLVIGNNETASPEYIFGAPEHLCTDSKQNIFVFDRAIGKIRKYNHEGKFITHIGRKGKGPGEFIGIDVLFINSGDTLITFDTQGSRITYFSTSGEYLSWKKMDYSEIMWPRKVSELGPDHYALSFIKGESKDNLHITDRAFNIKFSLGKNYFSELFKNKVNLLIESFTGSVSTRDSELLYAPYAYEGNIYRIFPDNPKKKAQIIKGKVNKEAYVLVNAKGNYKKENRPYSMRIFAESDKFAIKFYNESRGLFHLKDGSIVHFTLIKSGKERIFGYEKFNSSGKLIDYQAIYKKKIIEDKPTDIPIFVQCIDSEDNFYLIDRTGLPVIKRIKLK